MTLSVIIPTYNRSAVLLRVLEALQTQTFDGHAFEVVVVDDGSSDDTRERVAAFGESNAAYSLRYVRQDNRGPAAARNTGLDAARGDLVLFLGDDTIPRADLLDRHVRYHREHSDDKLAVVGYTTWPEEMRTTPFMRFAGEAGPQFGYAKMQPGVPLPYYRFYTSNVSVPRRFLQSVDPVFDEDFPSAMWEDAELAYRLGKQGMVLHYLPEAVVYHEHPTRISCSYRRFREVGRMSRLMLAKHPELEEKIRSTRRLAWISRLAYPVRAIVSIADVLDASLRLPLPAPLYWLILGEGYARGAVSERAD